MTGRDDEYQNPTDVGSLSLALKSWLTAAADGASPEVQGHVEFTILCRSRSRAVRVASALRRRLECVSTGVAEGPTGLSPNWTVSGSTRALGQSLTSIESISQWLRGTAGRHQTRLVRLEFHVAGPAAPVVVL